MYILHYIKCSYILFYITNKVGGIGLDAGASKGAHMCISFGSFSVLYMSLTLLTS